MKKAFATYLCNDVFIPGAIALINSLNHFKTEFDVICMVTGDVSEEGRKRLETSGFLLENIEKIVPNRVEGIKDRYKDNSWMMFTKLNLWRMTSYEKLVFIDADCVTLCNIDEMMEYPAVSAVRDIGYGGISAGVLVLEPNTDFFDDIMANIDNDVYDNTYSDQSFLNWYLKDRDCWNEIPIVYNALQKRVPLLDGIKIYHYNGQKPWLTDKDNSCHWQMGENQIYQLWSHFYNMGME